MKCGINDRITMAQKTEGCYRFHCFFCGTAIITSTNSTQSTTAEEEMEHAHKVLHPGLPKRKHFFI